MLILGCATRSPVAESPFSVRLPDPMDGQWAVALAPCGGEVQETTRLSKGREQGLLGHIDPRRTSTDCFYRYRAIIDSPRHAGTGHWSQECAEGTKGQEGHRANLGRRCFCRSGSAFDRIRHAEWGGVLRGGRPHRGSKPVHQGGLSTTGHLSIAVSARRSLDIGTVGALLGLGARVGGFAS